MNFFEHRIIKHNGVKMSIKKASNPERLCNSSLERHLPLSVSVRCEHPAALGSSAPRYGFAVVIRGRYSSRPSAQSSLHNGPYSSPKPQSLPGSHEAAVLAASTDSVLSTTPTAIELMSLKLCHMLRYFFIKFEPLSLFLQLWRKTIV